MNTLVTISVADATLEVPIEVPGVHRQARATKCHASSRIVLIASPAARTH